MSKKHFNDEQIKELETNTYVISVTSKYINYPEEFKELFLKDYYDGMPPIEIFKKYGFDPDLFENDEDIILSRGSKWNLNVWMDLRICVK